MAETIAPATDSIGGGLPGRGLEARPGELLMKHTKTVIAIASLVGFIAVFLPYISAEGISLSLWDVHKMPGAHAGLLNGPMQPYVALVMFALPALLAGIA